jgi:D-threonate/D-erythronate kinase
MHKPVILADDLTGAMDTGVQLLKKWADLSVVFDGACINEITQTCDALVIDTESRNTSPEEAGSRIYGLIEHFRGSGLELAYKKIDSTLRGNVRKELDVLLQTGSYDLTAFVPALCPEMTE